MRDVAAETGVSPSTLTRLAQGQKPDADTLVTLLAWLNAEPAAFTVPRPAAEPEKATCLTPLNARLGRSAETPGDPS